MRTEDAMRRNEEGYSTNCYYAYGPHAWNRNTKTIPPRKAACW